MILNMIVCGMMAKASRGKVAGCGPSGPDDGFFAMLLFTVIAAIVFYASFHRM